MKKIHFISKNKLKSRTTLMNKMLRIWLKLCVLILLLKLNAGYMVIYEEEIFLVEDVSIPESEVMLLRTFIKNNRNGEM